MRRLLRSLIIFLVLFPFAAEAFPLFASPLRVTEISGSPEVNPGGEMPCFEKFEIVFRFTGAFDQSAGSNLACAIVGLWQRMELPE